MVIDIIDRAIRTKQPIEIEYSKDGVVSRFFQLEYISYSGKDNSCIHGVPLNSGTGLTFRIDRIKDIKIIWNVLAKDFQIDKSGLYLVYWLDFGFGYYELISYNKGDKLVGRLPVFAYHYIPHFTGEYNHQWHALDEEEYVKENSIYIFAYKEGMHRCDDIDEDFNTKPSEKTTEHAGIHYTAVYLPTNSKINKNLNILAYSCVPKFDELNCDVSVIIDNEERD